MPPNSLFLILSKARQAKTEHMEMKISQPIFSILVVLTKNELTKTYNEPGKSPSGFKCLTQLLKYSTGSPDGHVFREKGFPPISPYFRPTGKHWDIGDFFPA